MRDGMEMDIRDGLSRESIPVLSRVIAVVDAFDAMINDRPYRKGMPISKAIEELKSCAGSQFDPYIVSEFIRLVSEKYADSLAADSKQGAADGGVGADGNGENVGDRTAPGDGLADADGDGASTDDETDRDPDYGAHTDGGFYCIWQGCVFVYIQSNIADIWWMKTGGSYL